MLLYTGSFFLCWIIPLIIGLTPLYYVPRLQDSLQRATSSPGFFQHGDILPWEMPKVQKDNPGTSLLVVYVCVVLGTPAWVKAIRRMFSSSQTTTPNADNDEDVDGGIGFSTYNEEPPNTQETSGSNEGAKVESDVPPNDRWTVYPRATIGKRG